MANFKFEWWYIIPIIAVIAIFGPGWFEMATWGSHRDMTECEEDLTQIKLDYPNGYYPDSCVVITQAIANCVSTNAGSDTLQDNVGDVMTYWDTTGDMDITEQIKYDCVHSPLCDTSWDLDNHGRCCSTNTAQVENVKAHYAARSCQMFYYSSLTCVECAGSGDGGSTCNTAADTDCNNQVSLSELSAYTTKWKQGQVSLTLLAQATSAWKQG